jgi:tetratricopeptide (TPR) repeat protein
MKSEHRHELKTNELAEWLSNLPQWTKQNLITIICVSALVVVLAGVYLWRGYNRNIVQVRNRTEFTNLINQVSGAKIQIVQASAQGRDLAFMLIQLAKNLDTFAQDTKNNRMAAMALVKRAQALRAELHYGTVEQQYIIDQTKKAKASYATAFGLTYGEHLSKEFLERDDYVELKKLALEKSSTNPVLAAAAEFGLGLCEEELGNFKDARKIYGEIVANSEYEGIVTVTQAQRRLKTMADYEQKIAFVPDPNPEPVAASQPSIDITPAEVKLPANIIPPFNFNRPLDLSMFAEAAEANEPGGSEE